MKGEKNRRGGKETGFGVEKKQVCVVVGAAYVEISLLAVSQSFVYSSVFPGFYLAAQQKKNKQTNKTKQNQKKLNHSHKPTSVIKQIRSV